MNIDTRNPIGAQDTETELRLLPPTHFRYGKNGRSGSSDVDGDGGTENIRGNILRNETYQQFGTVIGTAPDIKNNAVIKFNCRQIKIPYTGAGITNISLPTVQMTMGTTWPLAAGTDLEVIQGSGSFIANIDVRAGNLFVLTVLSGTPTLDPITNVFITTSNYIYRYYENTGVFEFLTNPIAMSQVLNFSLDHRIINPRVIESSFGQLLTWTEGTQNQPRLMNIDKMKDGGEYFGIANSEIYISLAKYPPRLPSISLVADTATLVNNILDKYFQFAVTYVYEDGQETSLSKYSEVSLRTEDLFIGNPTQANYKNAIDVTFNTGYYTKKVNLYRRIGNGVSSTGEENTEWYRWKTYDVLAENQSITVRFFNTEAVTPFSRINSDKLFETIPIFANEIEVVDSSQIVLGAITEGEDAITISATSEAIFTEHEQIITSQYFSNDVKWKQAGSLSAPSTLEVFKQPLFPGDPYEVELGDLLSIIIIQDIATPAQRVHTINRVIQPSDLVGGMLGYSTWLQAELTSRGIPYTYTVLSGSYEFVLGSTYIYSADMVIIKNAINWFPAFSNNYLRTTFKEGAKHELMIIHYDENNRQWPAQALPSVYIPTLPERYPLSGSFDYIQQSVALRVRLTNQPPLGAISYSIVHRNSLSKSQSFIINSIAQDGQNVVIDFKKCYDFLVEMKVVFDFTDFGAEGTRLRFLTRKYTYASTEIAAPRKITTIENVYNVVAYDATDVKITIANALLTDFSTEIGTGSLFEIFIEQPTPFYFEIYNGTITNPKTPTRQYDTYVAGTATMLITKGDSYRYWRSFKYDAESDENTPLYHIESFSINDYNNSYYYNKGRPQIETPDYKRQTLGEVFRWGGELINNTQVNNLSTWDEGNYAQVNARFGSITGLRQIGYTLKILQWANINRAFIGRREVQNADGSTQLVVTDNLIGTINPSEIEFGTKYPGSIISTGTELIFFDSLKSKWLVEGNNGVREIAMYQGPDGSPSPTMSTYWRALATRINTDSNYDIITGFDFLYRDAWVSIVNRQENTQETIYYNEFQNAWKYFVDLEHLNAAGTVKYIPDCYGNVGQSFFAFMQGNTFQFNKAVDGDGQPVYGELFKINSTDPVKPLVIETIGMLEPDKVKVFLTHEYHANLPISLVELFIPPNQMYPNGMYSQLKPANYKYREGVFYADIKRDGYTKGIPGTEALLRASIAGGRPMRGHVCRIRITFTTNEYVRLFSTGIGMIPSEKS